MAVAGLGLEHAAGLGVLLALHAVGVFFGQLAQAGLAVGPVLRLKLSALDGLLRRVGGLFIHALGEAAVFFGQLDRVGLGVEGPRPPDRLDPPLAGLVDAAVDQEARIAGDLLVGETQRGRLADGGGVGMQRRSAGQIRHRRLIGPGGAGGRQGKHQGGEAGERKEAASAHGTAGLT